MAVNRHSFPLALLAMASLASCAFEEEAEPLASVTYEVPFFDEPLTLSEDCFGENTSLACPFLIKEDGSLTHRGVAVEASEVHSIETRRAREGRGSLLTIVAHPAADFADVVTQLSAMFPELASLEPPPRSFFDPVFELFDERRRTVIDFRPNYALVELEQFQAAVDRPSPELAAEFEQIGFAGMADEYAFPVWVGYSPEFDACIIKIYEGEAVASEELYDRAFMHLDQLVQKMGGVEMVFNDPDTFDRVIARVQSSDSTPWRCIAAATYNIERAGWPEIRFEVFADEREAAASQ